MSPSGPPQRVALRIEQDVPCPDCGYNLRGLRMDGRCPECGRPAVDTFARPLRAATGVLAEMMMRRSSRLVMVQLAWWVLAGLVAAVPGGLRPIAFTVVTALAGAFVIYNVTMVARLRRQAQSKRGGSSKPLQDVAGLWFWLHVLAALGTGLLMLHAAGPIFGIPLPEVPPLGLIIVLLGTVGAAGASHVFASNAAATVLRRLALPSPSTAVVVAAVAQAALIVACLAPSAGLAPLLAGRVGVGVASWAVWMFASHRVIASLQEAQGSVVSLGRASRR